MISRDFLKNLEGDQKELGARVFDKAHLAYKRGELMVTDFLDPGQQVLAKQIVKKFPGLTYKFDGGTVDAERTRMLIIPTDLLDSFTNNEMVQGISLLKITGNFRFQKVSHRDFLGAIMNSGVTREKIGDIIVAENGCYLVIAAEIRDYLINNLTRVHQVPVKVIETDRSKLKELERPQKIIKATVSSLRLDAVASAGYGVSRSKTVQLIASEKVRVNWETRSAPDFQVQAGDLISIRGMGRMTISQVNGETRKGRISVELVRYI